MSSVGLDLGLGLGLERSNGVLESRVQLQLKPESFLFRRHFRNFHPAYIYPRRLFIISLTNQYSLRLHCELCFDQLEYLEYFITHYLPEGLFRYM